jgi:hypothetical protein
MEFRPYSAVGTKRKDSFFEEPREVKSLKLTAMYKGTRGPTDSNGAFTFEVREEITAGTGRFEGVVGIVTSTGIIHQNQFFSYSSDGWLLNTHTKRQNVK